MLNLHNEILIPIQGFEDLYKVSNRGYVTNNRKILKTYINNNGYVCLKLTNNTIVSAFLLHRLVAAHFIPNPENKREVNHEDGNKLNCDVNNLSWVTSTENKLHAKINGLWEYNKPSTGIKLGNSSTYNNVIFDKSRKKWVGTVRYNNKNHYSKRFDTEIEAAKHVNWIIDTLGLKDRIKNNV